MTSSNPVTAVDRPGWPIRRYGGCCCWDCDATLLRAQSSRPEDASLWPPSRRIAWITASHLFRLDFLILRLKKQQHLVSSTTSTSAFPTAIGALDLSAVAPSSSLDRSMFVEPRTTWTDGWRFSCVNRCPRPSMPLGLDSDQAAFFRSAASPLSFPVRCRSRLVGEMTSWFVCKDPTGVDMFLPVQSNSPSSTYPFLSQRSWNNFRK